MIWAIILKELREHGKWFVLGAFAAMLYLYTDVMTGHSDMAKVILHISIVTGIVLGLLQTLPEKYLGLFPFLRHRPMTLTSIFMAKVVAALILFSIVVVVPCFIAIMLVDDLTKMLIHYTSAQIVTNMLFGVVVYFLTMTFVLREARFYGSRVVGILFAVVCYYIAYEATTKEHFLFFMTCVGCTVVMAGWGTFTDQRSRIVTKASIGITLLVSYITVTLFVVINLEAMAKQFSVKDDKNDSSIYYRVTSQGPISIERNKTWVYKDANNHILSDKQVESIFEEELLGMYLRQKPTGNTNYLRKKYYTRLTSHFYYSKLQKRILAYKDDGRYEGSIGIDGFYQEQTDNLHQEEYFDNENLNEKLLIRSQRELHLFDTNNKKIELFFSCHEDIRKFDVVASDKNIPMEIVVLTEKHLYILDPSGKAISQIQHLPLKQYDKIRILITNQKQYIFRYIKTDSEKDRVIEYARTGKITKEYTVTKNPEYVEDYDWRMYFLKSSLLSNFACKYFLPHLSLPNYKASLLWLVMIPCLLCLVIARIYAVSIYETTCWMIVCCVAGIPGLLTFVSMCHFVVVRCHFCNAKYNLQNKCCQKCSAKPLTPAKDGTEIFA
ncbi:hypothetical protein [Candidatus Uabimicrobium amorphum]|uniref:Uncharacterized protein n=1 Tax=Uabimicrobium amorphum TaxID=2596890 RepID=A0A5S9ISL8_UABAM|nr:hypothetical protein [Candidatus Uabimicrobium amorphum]BBM87174.1 hypothetical protein UABAM_05577 [Candidatus Uabimicrobium amorphum]